ncbi:MAG: hypothetical protein EB116_15200, partial [Betaproteobacteria bacterium]|nr:hypothetical protein [Betaproteobacteria bacterium]
ALLLRRPRLVWLALAWLWLCSMPITGNLLIRAAEQGAVHLPAEHVPQAQAVVVLSGMARTVSAPSGPSSFVREWGDAVDRLEGGLALMRARRAPRLIFTGGRVPWDVLPTTEGDWLMEQACNRGLPAAAISITPPVQNTAEEAQAVAASSALPVSDEVQQDRTRLGSVKETLGFGELFKHMTTAEVSINPVPADADQATLEKGVNFPALQRVIGNTT